MSRVEHPVIAVNGLLDTSREPTLRLACRYAESILKAGGVALAIPPVGGPMDVERLLDSVDGLLLSGGDDFRTEPLGLGPTHPEAHPVPLEKQEFDLLLARLALDRRMPVLGICYGMQLLGVAEGAGLLQHLPEDRPGAQIHSGNVSHPVHVLPGTKLARLLGLEQVSVVSRHHQALSSPPRGWRTAALDEEGLIEAIEHPNHPFAVGVQWHPELAPEGTVHDRLFRGLVGAAGMAAAASPASYSRS